MAETTKKTRTNAKWRVISTDHATRTVIMQRGSETAAFEMGSLRRKESAQ